MKKVRKARWSITINGRYFSCDKEETLSDALKVVGAIVETDPGKDDEVYVIEVKPIRKVES